MSRYSDQIRDEYGRTIPKVAIYVYKWDAYTQLAGDLETLTDDLAAPLGNPLTSDPDGIYYFNSVDGQKLLEYHYGGKVQERSLILVGALPVPQATFGGLFINAATLTIPVGMDLITTTGYSTLDKGAAIYAYDAAVNTAYVAANPRVSFIELGGRGFRLSFEQDLSLEMFGSFSTGTAPSITAENLAAFNACVDFMSSHFGGGTITAPDGIFDFADQITPGDGTNTTQSTKHHNIKIKGAGSGSSPSVSSVQATGLTVFRYAGTANAAKAVMELAGPLHGIQLENIALDANGLAGIGLKTTHVDSFVYRNLTVRNWTANSYVYTTRTGNVTGAAHGCSNGSVYDCFAYDPASNTANGILLTSGVSSGTTLVGNPDAANIDFYGGVYFYGGSTGSSGAEFAGADNNTMLGTQFIPASGNDGGGKSFKWTQWTGSPVFPLGNQLRGVGFSQGMTGTAGTGGNTAWYDPSDSGYVPTIAGLNAVLDDGRQFINGQRVYGVYSVATAELNSSTQSSTSASFADVPGMSLSLNYPAGSKLRLSFTGLASKATTGTGDFVLFFNGSAYGQTTSRVTTNGTFSQVAGELLVDLPAVGSAVVAKVQFKSDGTNQVQINCGVLIATVLF